MTTNARSSVRSWFALAVLTVAGAMTCSALIASNMGHVSSVTLYKAGDSLPEGGVSKSGKNTINLPYAIGPNIVTAKDLMDDITLNNVAFLERFVEATDGLEIYTGRKGSPLQSLNLAAGECYYLTMSTTTFYTIVGNDKPSYAVALNSAQSGVSKTGTNFVSLPLNTTVTTAKALIDDIGFANVANIQRFIRATDGLETYTGRKGSPNVDFPISNEECYFVVMNPNPNSPVNYTASHY